MIKIGFFTYQSGWNLSPFGHFWLVDFVRLSHSCLWSHFLFSCFFFRIKKTLNKMLLSLVMWMMPWGMLVMRNFWSKGAHWPSAWKWFDLIGREVRKQSAWLVGAPTRHVRSGVEKMQSRVGRRAFLPALKESFLCVRETWSRAYWPK